jgi:hypothetical protein
LSGLVTNFFENIGKASSENLNWCAAERFKSTGQKARLMAALSPECVNFVPPRVKWTFSIDACNGHAENGRPQQSPLDFT